MPSMFLMCCCMFKRTNAATTWRQNNGFVKIINHAREGWLSHPQSEDLRAYWQVRGELAPLDPESSCVLRKARVIVPGALRERGLELAHEGHLGIVRTKQ